MRLFYFSTHSGQCFFRTCFFTKFLPRELRVRTSFPSAAPSPTEGRSGRTRTATSQAFFLFLAARATEVSIGRVRRAHKPPRRRRRRRRTCAQEAHAARRRWAWRAGQLWRRPPGQRGQTFESAGARSRSCPHDTVTYVRAGDVDGSSVFAFCASKEEPVDAFVSSSKFPSSFSFFPSREASPLPFSHVRFSPSRAGTVGSELLFSPPSMRLSYLS
jgi:hypothetical protein